ncbi:cell envelope integrity protein TolA [Rariglobus hedericola]|uniref:TonB C-terminal domain-containing protein n=1 Tax=Rariglobus hedericola TaxID=2597822 RepID=A0A556QNU0_9BACT|nr:cell envelope integrity protein TolA [Rariglobus hedericola]TSJ78304.1 TonB C-terminal domain-containing protein [Rariglobus hedericola]
MSARTTNAFFASAALHALLLCLIAWFAYRAHQSDQEAPQVFELVAGAGDNFAATEAPALGVPGGVKFEAPEPPAPIPAAAAPAEAAPAEPEPVTSPIEAVAPPVKTPPKPAKPKPTDYKPVNMAKMVDRIADKRAAKIEKQVKADKAAADARAAKEAELNSKRTTKAEFDRMNKGKSSPSQKAPTAGGGTGSLKRIDAEGIAGGVAGGSTANKTGGAGGKALTRQDIELSEAYISLLIQRLKEAHKKPEGVSDLLEASVKFRLTSSGSVVNVTIISSSRNSEFDQSVLAAFRRISLPPPPANLKTNDYTITFKMREDT